MIRPTLLVLALAPVLFGCGSEPVPPAARRFLALGDSYTIGQSVPVAERWPVRLADRLRSAGVNVGAPRIVAATGWTTDELSAGMDAAQLAGPFDLVTLLIGVNNQFRGRDEDEYRRQFAALLARAIALAGERPGRVVVLSIPDWGVTPFASGRDRAAIGRAIDRFNAINLEETRRAGAAYVDVTPFSRRAAGDAALVADDGLHPSGKMYAAWADLAFPAAREALAPAPAAQ